MVTVNRLNTSFVLVKEKQAAAFSALLSVARAGKGVFPYRDALSLVSLICECWRWSVSVDPLTGAIRAIAYEGEEVPRDTWDLLFSSLAPFVEPWGYIIYFSHDRTCEYLFDGRTAISLDYARCLTSEEVGSARAAALGRSARGRAGRKIRDHSAGVCEFTRTHQEARAWLSENANPRCFASNAFRGKGDALDYVERLYQLGARQVCVVNVFDRLIDTLVEGGPYADTLVIELPGQPERAQALRDYCLHASPPGHDGIITHEAIWWVEAIPDEGWIGIRWD